MKKLTWHMHHPDEGLIAVANAAPTPYVKQLFFSDLRDYFPQKRTIARLMVEGTDNTEAQYIRLGQAGARAYLDLADNAFAPHRYDTLRGRVWAFEGVNEPYVKTPEARLQYSAFIAEWARLMNEANRRVLVGSFSSGTPDVNDDQALRELMPVWIAAARPGNGLALHQYGWPRLMDGAEWYAMRHELLLRALDRIGAPRPNCIHLTEFGLDGTGRAPGVHPGWRSATRGNFSTLLSELEWAEERLQACPLVESVALYTFGSHQNEGWWDFEMGPQSVALLQEMQRWPRLIAPVDDTTAISAHFGERGRWWKTFHKGMDYSVPAGTPVYAAHSGEASYDEWPAGWGHYVTVKRGELCTVYAHLREATAKGLGGHVEPGDTIGLSGSSGKSTGPHLHFEVQIDGVAVDPLRHLRGQP
jgi:hypothetical protein